MRKMVNGRDIHAVKAIIAKVYYNCEYDQLKLHISDAKKTFENAKYNYQNLKKYFRLMEIETAEEVLKFINDMKYESNIIKKIEDTEKEVASRDVINKLSTFVIIKENELIYLKGKNLFAIT